MEPLCLTSANKSGAKSAITSNDFADLHPLLDAIVETELGIPSSMSRAGSTVVGMRSKLVMFALELVFKRTKAALLGPGNFYHSENFYNKLVKILTVN